MSAEDPTDEREKDYAAVGRVAFRVLPGFIEWVKRSIPALAIGFAGGGGVGTVINKAMGRQPVTVETIRAVMREEITPMQMKMIAHEAQDSIYRDSMRTVLGPRLQTPPHRLVEYRQWRDRYARNRDPGSNRTYNNQ